LSQVTVKGYVGRGHCKGRSEECITLKKITDLTQTPNACFLKDIETDIAMHYGVQC
jgi:hypothetical protein